jgi:hypothetical protein
VVASRSGASEPRQPSGDNGLANGAWNVRAVTVTGSKPEPSICRIIEVAWYRCVELT